MWENQPIFSISVFDNGDGFTKENIKSFSTYKSDYKIQEGCKGVRRITYLKIFEEVKIIIFSKDEHHAQISLNSLHKILLKKKMAKKINGGIHIYLLKDLINKMC